MDSTLAKRTLCFCFGLAVNSFGIALITRSGLGATQISSLPYVWSLATPAVSYALATFIVNMGFFAVEAILASRKFFPLQLFQIVPNIIFSSFLGLSMQLLAFWQPSMLPLADCRHPCWLLHPRHRYRYRVLAPSHLRPRRGHRARPCGYIGQEARHGEARLRRCARRLSHCALLCRLRRLEGVGVGTILTVLITSNIVNFADAHLPLVGRMHELACA